MGLGRFGGGIGVVRWLAGQGAEVLVTDLEPADRLAGSLEQIRDLVDRGAVDLRLGGHEKRDFAACDLVVANPGVLRPWENEHLRAAAAAGVSITTEIRLLVERLDRACTIGVTGTAGKSTTAAMIHHILRELGRPAHLGGNIGGSLLNDLRRISSGDPVVLELSSFMLYWLGQGAGDPGAVGWSPSLAVMTNLTDNHLDWHGTFERYAEAKRTICRYQEAGNDHLVWAADGDHVRLAGWAAEGPAEACSIAPRDPGADPWPIDGHLKLAVPGEHNRLNARLAVTAATIALGAEHDPGGVLEQVPSRFSGSRPLRPADIAARPYQSECRPGGPYGALEADLARRCAESLRSFRGLPHRLQLVGERDGLRFIDDSKSTTPRATCLAVGAFDDPSKVHLIAGGYDKGLDLSPIVELAPRLAGLYTIGATGRDLAAAVAGRAPTALCHTLEAAVEHATARGRRGEVLLLSPGCASWDQYDNYEQRGEAFCECVKKKGLRD